MVDCRTSQESVHMCPQRVKVQFLPRNKEGHGGCLVCTLKPDSPGEGLKLFWVCEQFAMDDTSGMNFAEYSTWPIKECISPVSLGKFMTKKRALRVETSICLCSLSAPPKYSQLLDNPSTHLWQFPGISSVPMSHKPSSAYNNKELKSSDLSTLLIE